MGRSARAGGAVYERCGVGLKDMETGEEQRTMRGRSGQEGGNDDLPVSASKTE